MFMPRLESVGAMANNMRCRGADRHEPLAPKQYLWLKTLVRNLRATAPQSCDHGAEHLTHGWQAYEQLPPRISGLSSTGQAGRRARSELFPK